MGSCRKEERGKGCCDDCECVPLLLLWWDDDDDGAGAPPADVEKPVDVEVEVGVKVDVRFVLTPKD